MTYVVKDIADHLKASPAIADAFSDRIYGDVIPQDKRRFEEALVIYYMSDEPEMCLAGEVGTHRSQVQIDVWTDGNGGPGRAHALGELVRNRLNGYRGTFGTGCYGTSRLLRSDNTSAPPVDGSDQHRRRVSMDFEIIHTASVPTLT